MRCPQCGERETRVVDSRDLDDSATIRRRRECSSCATRFTTYERLEPQLIVRKRNGRLEPFSTAKLAVGISAALADRPVSGSAIERLAEEVEASLRARGSQVTSEDIGLEVLERLRSLDEVGYLRFASVYKEFQDAADFEKEVAALESAE